MDYCAQRRHVITTPEGGSGIGGRGSEAFDHTKAGGESVKTAVGNRVEDRI